jgi:large subunit ribosomal protein L24
MTVRIHKGDTVEVITGSEDDKGKRGEVIRVVPDDKSVVVTGVRMRTKHQKQVQSQGRTVNPGKLRFEGPFDISNVMLVCPKCGKTTRVALSRDGDKVSRVCKKCNASIDE